MEATTGAATKTLFSILTCPKCGLKSQEPMPENACQWFYTCKGCDERLKPKPGDCCVFCSYGDTACPPKLKNEDDDCCSKE